MTCWPPPGGQVALLAEGVGRNITKRMGVRAGKKVALLAEGVDRNYHPMLANLAEQVALLAEGVDRN